MRLSTFLGTQMRSRHIFVTDRDAYPATEILHTPKMHTPFPPHFCQLNTNDVLPTYHNHTLMVTSETVHPAASSHISTTIGKIITIFEEKIADKSLNDLVQYGSHWNFNRYRFSTTAVEDNCRRSCVEMSVTFELL